jgi:hypothetical protein
MNRAVDGDTVGVVVLDKDQWSGSLEVTFLSLPQPTVLDRDAAKTIDDKQ